MEAEQRTGTQLGNYRLLSELGRGGMGVVYLAEHVHIGRTAAIKVLLPEFSRDEGLVKRFFNEARAASNIRHPGIVGILDFGYDTAGNAFIVMEYLAGQSLAQRVRSGGGKLTAAVALAYGHQIAAALAAVHNAGITHRDLKLDNMLVTDDFMLS